MPRLSAFSSVGTDESAFNVLEGSHLLNLAQGLSD